MDIPPSFSPDEPIGPAIEAILDAANKQRGEEIHGGLRDALNAIARHPDRFDVLIDIAIGLPRLTSPSGAGFLAVWLGGAVEKGTDPEPAIPHLFETLLRWSRTVQLPDADEGRRIPEDWPLDEETISGLEWIGQGLVAHLARSPAARSAYAARPEVLAELERVEPVSSGCLWVHELLRKRNGTLLVLHVEGRKGVRVEYENVSNNFHLFTLLQAALAGRMPGSQKVSRGAVEIARGERDGAASDSAWWHYGPGTFPEANVAASVWGEASPETIPEIDGEQVLLLWPSQLGRSWDAGFFTPRIEAAPPRVNVLEELTPEQFQTWRSKLRLPLAGKKTWWKFW